MAEKNTSNNPKISKIKRVRFDHCENPSFPSCYSSSENEKTNENKQNILTEYFCKIKNLFSSHNLKANENVKAPKSRANLTEIKKPCPNLPKNILKNLSCQRISDSVSIGSRDSIETNYCPMNMTGNEHTTYQIVKSALKYGYANHIINKKDPVFWLRKLPGSDLCKEKPKVQVRRPKFRKRKRLVNGQVYASPSSSYLKRKQIKRKSEISSSSSVESILDCPYKICKIKCISKK
ncbi:hypothetical protein WA026_003771 [Henosepilachna vigintioctopunctata]|uniref:Uncharacterized protein n=1 Tax=Henosepilachna vigintioctopunctata TaxID=420089 RepID=A0AAW1U5M3_9CUCU